MKNSDMPAMPIFNENGCAQVARHALANNEPLTIGLTKREHFAVLAMQGLLSNSGGVVQSNLMTGFGWCNCDENSMAEIAINCADALLAELEKDNQA